jgi:putative membrane protein
MKPSQKLLSLALSGVFAAVCSSAALAQSSASSPASDRPAANRPAADRSAGSNQSNKLDRRDARALRNMAEANLAEVEAGKLAAGKARSEEVKKFAQHMVDDHGKQLQEIQKLASARSVDLPSQPAAKHRAAMKKLEGTSADNFDGAYMSQMVKDHRDALKLAQRTAKNAKDSELKAAAEKAAPDIKEHLQTAEQLAGKSKSASAGSSKPASSSDSSKSPSAK